MTVEELTDKLRRMLDRIAEERGHCTVAIRPRDLGGMIGGTDSKRARALKETGF